MPVSPLVLELLEQAAESGLSAEEVCKDRPHLVAEVRACLRQLSSVRDELDALFPEHEDPTSSRTATPEIPGYSVGDVIGRGGMGVVYRAVQLGLSRPVAVKMMLNGGFAGPPELARFRQEAEALAALQHPNIVQIHDVGESGGLPYFAMELVAGGSLARKLGGVPLSARDAATLMLPLADAVEAAHRGGIVHRDLKPSNILLTAGGTPKITDFGLARRLGAGLSMTAMRIGTPGYMAPEQVEGRARVSGVATDVYALGAILYEMLTGRPPFRAETAAATERQVVAAEPAAPSRLNAGIPRDLETICLKCLRKDPGRRYPAALELGEDLGRFLRNEPIQARPVSPVDRAGKWVRRHPTRSLALFGGAAIAVALLVGGWWMMSARWSLTRAVEADLRAATQALRESNWGGGHTALERARGRLGSGGAEELHRRLARADRELDLATRLDAIRLDRIRLEDGGPAHWMSRYEAAFRSAGIFQGGDSPAIAARRINATSIEAALVAALDEWGLDATYLVNLRPSNPADVAREAWLLEVARTADPDPTGWRDRFRDAARRKSRKSLADLADSAKLATTPASLLVALGALIDNRGGDAIPYLTRVQRMHPGDLWVNFHLGYLNWRKKDREQAVRYFQAALATRPDAITILHFHADALKSIGRSDDASYYFERAVEVAPADTIALLDLASHRMEKGSDGEAVALLRRGLLLRPDNAILVREYEVRLRDGLMRLGLREESRGIWAKLIEAAPLDFDQCDGYAELCLYLGHEDECREACRAFLRRFGETQDARVAERLGRACLLLPAPGGLLDDARALIDRALADKQPKPEWLRPYFMVAKGLAEYRSGRLASAISIMQGPASAALQPAPLLVSSMALYRVGRKEEGLRTFDEAIRSGDWEKARANDREKWIHSILRREAEAMMLPDLQPSQQGKERSQKIK